MCRWLAYSGDPIPLELLVLKPANSLIDQSLHSRMGATTTNGDGFGVGWYDGVLEEPGVYRSVHPAWNDRNLRELAAHVSSGLFFAHIRASTGTAVQETNTHPFRYGRWLFMHNGLVRDYPRVRRDLLLGIDADLMPALEGSADSEVLFFLALTFGLDREPVAALERMAGFVEDVGAAHGVEHPLQMSVAATDGDRIYAARYSSEGSSRSLYFSTDAARAEGAPSRARAAPAAFRRGPCRRLGAARRPAKAPGTRCRRPRSGSCSRGRTSSARSRRAADADAYPAG